MSELLDVIDPSSGRVLEQRERAEVHEAGLWHQVFHCLVVRPSAHSIILQRRSLQKAAFPGKLDLSATGHLEAGETPIEGIRELTEELGLTPDPGELVPVGRRLLADDQGEGQNRELVHLYLLADDRPLCNYEVAVDEVTGLVEVASEALLDLLADRSPEVEVRSWSPGSDMVEDTIRRTDLVADTDGYWIVAAVMADRFLRGETPIAI